METTTVALRLSLRSRVLPDYYTPTWEDVHFWDVRPSEVLSRWPADVPAEAPTETVSVSADTGMSGGGHAEELWAFKAFVEASARMETRPSSQSRKGFLSDSNSVSLEADETKRPSEWNQQDKEFERKLREAFMTLALKIAGGPRFDSCHLFRGDVWGAQADDYPKNGWNFKLDFEKVRLGQIVNFRFFFLPPVFALPKENMSILQHLEREMQEVLCLDPNGFPLSLDPPSSDAQQIESPAPATEGGGGGGGEGGLQLLRKYLECKWLTRGRLDALGCPSLYGLPPSSDIHFWCLFELDFPDMKSFGVAPWVSGLVQQGSLTEVGLNMIGGECDAKTAWVRGGFCRASRLERTNTWT
uniref:Uncharacterized protein n=1 Tax=Chromera velia CCMP2878 TaxID=1169474 RepID=A0A0G4I503_9ALVE|eukprot:Cvel_10978.t1-p1 / transcript=Cvel_10978.t1 / gene=Cvel_10978 / organism=Chromera_velia_CCMP2878 / gene_product=hypothetical protein / transcript_product=hypothetical protein / location=Cvel_scaffold675:56664-59935(+) / protein_length=356 / sequence_SO=supercontig / SO=protein_coding / is_pseudo=false